MASTSTMAKELAKKKAAMEAAQMAPEKEAQPSAMDARMAEVEAARAAAEGSPAVEAQEEATAPAGPTPMDLLLQLENGPSEADLVAWKAAHGDLYVLPLHSSDVFVYRYLKHFEWYKQLLANEKLVQDQEALKDAVVQRCVLWPAMAGTSAMTKQAGLRDLLFEVIMQSSYFIEPERAMSLVVKL